MAFKYLKKEPIVTNPAGSHNGASSRMFQKLDNIENKTEKLHDMHDQKNPDGVYSWYFPHKLPEKMETLAEATRELVDVSTKTLKSQERIAENQEEIIVEFKRNNEIQEAKLEFFKTQH